MDKFEMTLQAVMRLCERYNTPESMELREECEAYLKERAIYLAPERETRKILLELGAPDHLAGHPYSVAAVEMATQNPQLLMNLSMELYPRIGACFETSPERIERGIRNLVEVTWMRGNPEVRERYFGNIVNAGRGKPTNAEFLSRISNEVRERVALLN